MPKTLENMKLAIQETLDQLLMERLIPFKLTAHKVHAHGLDEFSVPFYDSRIHSVTFSLKVGKTFSEVVRAAVIDRVGRMTRSRAA